MVLQRPGSTAAIAPCPSSAGIGSKEKSIRTHDSLSGEQYTRASQERKSMFPAEYRSIKACASLWTLEKICVRREER